MNEPAKTLAFVASAAIMVALAVTTHLVNRPKTGGEFELVGKPFFEGFTSSGTAQSLEVSALDPKTLALNTFSIENKNGLWRIPSHHNYPAEAADRLAMTATSVMGIERESLAGRLASEHEKLGVVDPLDISLDGSDPEATGKRITIKDADNEVLVDLIVGKEAGEVGIDAAQESINASAPKKYYYVRRVDEQATYKSRIEIDLSTKFSDWIDPDLLRLDQNKLTKLEIDNYSLTEGTANPLSQMVTLVKSQGDQLKLARVSSNDPWELDSLNSETEELNLPRVNEIITVLDELKIAGVRPKHKHKGHLLLKPDLTINQRPEFLENPQETQRAISLLLRELEDKGFSLSGTQENLALVSHHGQLEIGTSDGVLYSLQIGKAVEGEDESIEIGLTSESSTSKDAKQPNEKATNPKDGLEASPDLSSPDNDDTASDSDDETDDQKDSSSESKNRFLMVSTSFSEDLLTNKPVKPTEPVKPVAPAGYQPAAKVDDTINRDEQDAIDEQDGNDAEVEKNEATEPEDTSLNSDSLADQIQFVSFSDDDLSEEQSTTNGSAANDSVESGKDDAEVDADAEVGTDAEVDADDKVDTDAEVDTDDKVEAESKEEPSDDASDEPATPAGDNQTDDNAEAQDERDPAFSQYEQDLAAYEEAKIEYELAVTRYEADQKAFADKIAAGKKLVAELNERFADWYYVVTAENLKTLQTKRSELVSPIAAADGEDAAIDPRLRELFNEPPLPPQSDISFPEIEGIDE